MITRKLLEAGICFAVIQSNSFLTKQKIFMNQEWEILASENDYPELKKLGFVLKKDEQTLPKDKNPKGVISYLLDSDEISEFRIMIEDYFDKVIDTGDGMVWELKDVSLKQQLKAS